MSRSDDYGVTNKDRGEAGKSSSLVERIVEMPSRLGLSREAARAEMERFRGIAEYETRKIFGQRSVLKQPVDIGSPRRAKRKAPQLNVRPNTRLPKQSETAGRTYNDAALRRGTAEQGELDLHD